MCAGCCRDTGGMIARMSSQEQSKMSRLTGTLLRRFYEEFGMPGEGPGPTLDISDLQSLLLVPAVDRAAVAQALEDQNLKREHGKCLELLDSILSDIAGETLLRELSESAEVTAAQLERLACGSLWHSMLAAIDVRGVDGQPVPLPAFASLDLPPQVQFQATVFGSLILRLYVALVFIREGELLAVTGAAA